jgi:mRNA interferase MazF
VANYVPDQGDLVWLEFDPQSGHEQKGRRPALVLSPKSYNAKVGLILCCPITSNAKGYPFEVEVETKEVSGVVLSDQVKSLDWQAREASHAGHVSPEVMNQMRQRLGVLLGIGVGPLG